MELIIAILFGIVQGLTEFIPVSSSGHLLLLHTLFPNFGSSDTISFDVALHVGTLLALCIVFWRDIVHYTSAFLRKPRTQTDQRDKRIASAVVIGVIPAGIAGLFLEDIVDYYLRSPWIVVAMLIIVGFLFMVVEHLYAKRVHHGDITEVTYGTALFVGFMQILALIPGTSRSGITLSAGMLVGLTRDAAARFSFLVAIPLVAAAGLKKFADMIILGVQASEIPLILVGMASSAIVGYIAIRELLKYLSARSLLPFALYRIGLGVVVAIIMMTV